MAESRYLKDKNDSMQSFDKNSTINQERELLELQKIDFFKENSDETTEKYSIEDNDLNCSILCQEIISDQILDNKILRFVDTFEALIPKKQIKLENFILVSELLSKKICCSEIYSTNIASVLKIMSHNINSNPLEFKNLNFIPKISLFDSMIRLISYLISKNPLEFLGLDYMLLIKNFEDILENDGNYFISKLDIINIEISQYLSKIKVNYSIEINETLLNQFAKLKQYYLDNSIEMLKYFSNIESVNMEDVSILIGKNIEVIKCFQEVDDSLLLFKFDDIVSIWDSIIIINNPIRIIFSWKIFFDLIEMLDNLDIDLLILKKSLSRLSNFTKNNIFLMKNLLNFIEDRININSFQIVAVESIVSILGIYLDSYNFDNSSIEQTIFLENLLNILRFKKTTKFIDSTLETSICYLSNQQEEFLMMKLTDFLIQKLNYGGIEGFCCSNENDLIKLDLVNHTLDFVLSLKNFKIELQIFEEEFDEKALQSVFSSLIQWYFFNFSSVSNYISPAIDKLEQICAKIKKYFNAFGLHQRIRLIIFKVLIKNDQELLECLKFYQNKRKINSSVFFQIIKRSQSALYDIFKSFADSDEIIFNISKNYNALSYFLRKTSLFSEHSIISFETIRNREKNFTYEILEEEFANKVSMINQPGQSFSGISNDWSANKKGARGRLFYFQMNGKFNDEFSILISLRKEIEIKSIKLGCNTVFHDQNDKVLGVPNYVEVEGGSSLDKIVYIGTLRFFNDEGYSNFGVKVLEKNFNKLISSSSGKPFDCLSSLDCKKVKYLKFKFRRPYITFIEQISLLSNKPYKNMAISISFLSVTGYDSSDAENLIATANRFQDSVCLKILSHMYKPENIATTEHLISDKSIQDFILVNFSKLSPLLYEEASSWINHIIKKIIEKEESFRFYILKFILKQKKLESHLSLLDHVIKVHKDRLLVLQKLFSYLKTEINNYDSEILSHHNVNSICKLFTKWLRLNDLDLNDTFEVDDCLLKSLFKRIENFDHNNHSEILKLIALFFEKKHYFRFKNIDSEKIITQSWDEFYNNKKFIYLDILGSITFFDRAASAWLDPLTNIIIDSSLKLLKSRVNSYIQISLNFLYLVSLNKTMREKFIRLSIVQDLYTIIKEEIDNQDINIDLVSKIIFNFCYKQEDQKFVSRMLYHDMDLNLNSKFLKKILIPMITHQYDVAIHFNILEDDIFINNIKLGENLNLVKHPLEVLCNNKVHHVSCSLRFDQVLQSIFKRTDVTLFSRILNKDVKLEQIVGDYIKEIEEKEEFVGFIDLYLGKSNSNNSLPPQNPISVPFLKYFFEEFKGFTKIISLSTKNLIVWKDKKRAEKILFAIKDLVNLSKLPDYNMLISQSVKIFIFMANIISGEAQYQNAELSYEEDQEFIKEIFLLIDKLFCFNKSKQLKLLFSKEGFLDKIHEEIGRLAKISKRKKLEKRDEVNNKSEEVKSTENLTLKKQISQKKGTGYNNESSDLSPVKLVMTKSQIEQKSNSSLLNILISILVNFIDGNNWIPDELEIETFITSPLLIVIESALRSASMIELSKNWESNLKCMQILQALALNSRLVKCLIEIGSDYDPPQNNSIYQLLTNLSEIATIFLNCLTSEDENSQNKFLATEIIKSHKVCQEKISQLLDTDKHSQQKIIDSLSKPLEEKYRILLGDLRFDYVSLKDSITGAFRHNFSSFINNNPLPQQKLIRLAQELADLSSSLPIEHTNAIFVRIEESRVDVIKALIIGVNGTPYSNGVYEFDIFFDDNYPNSAPKVNLMTTGNAKVRFNPNLYNCGKVCLSLLGTWRGNASESWDPKLSSLLQVLVSIQSMIMSEDVYFNEPNFEREAGTEEGEKKNEGYSNIVRYNSIKHAMIGQIKNPPKGFESVIKRHFYVKKEEILKEIKKWIELSDEKEAVYTGLVNDHNPFWSKEFRESGAYKKLLIEAYEELQIELNKIEIDELIANSKETKSKEIKEDKIKENILKFENLEEVDVSYDKVVKHKELNIDNEAVKDRWSRYIGAMGLDAVTKQANSSVCLIGIGVLGAEIAKNVVLSGVKKFGIFDDHKVELDDLTGQFFLTRDDIGKKRGEASISKLQQLNLYVKVELAENKSLNLEHENLAKMLKGYNVLIVTEKNLETNVILNEFCRKNKIYFISTDVYGPIARIFNDFGENFQIIDKDGEEPQDLMIKSISICEKGIVTLIDGQKHNLEDGDIVQIRDVIGCKKKADENGTSNINGEKFKVKVINRNQFMIGDTTIYDDYERNGLAKLVKQIEIINFQSMGNALNNTKLIDKNLSIYDFTKESRNNDLHAFFLALDGYQKKNNKAPTELNGINLNDFHTLLNDTSKELNISLNTEMKLIDKIASSVAGVFPPLNALIGGIVSQEVIKSITQKFIPINQIFYMDCIELLPDLDTNYQIEQQIKKDLSKNQYPTGRLKLILGDELMESLRYSKVFLVGSGAIGCELLKNYAMMSLGTGQSDESKSYGEIFVTDPDVIEVSNLNRQFLFREKHLRKPKSITAAAAAIQMNPDLKGHIKARLDKVHEGTIDMYDNKFYQNQTLVTNALDNVQARRFIDSRCVTNKTPLIESGTLGPKGHVQVILPNFTESYNSQEDPQEDNEIPQCTLKMFPEDAIHCVEWARDKFAKLFSQKPKALKKLFTESNLDALEVKLLNDGCSLLSKHPKDFSDCIYYARRKFEKYFKNDISQLIHTYPHDMTTKEGKLFWTLPKRPPTSLEFDPENNLHADFVAACSCLRARIFNITVPEHSRTEKGKRMIAIEASKAKLRQFVPSEEKSKIISQEMNKSKKSNNEETDNEMKEKDDSDVLKEKFSQLKSQLKVVTEDFCTPQEFEKDNDSNYHIDFIYAAANCRASNYKLGSMDWLTVKLKAGRIVPALATTTACIAALQTIELCKIVKKLKKEDMRNTFLNLATPLFTMCEPADPKYYSINEKFKVSIWDQWYIEVIKDDLVVILFEKLQEKYGLEPKDFTIGSRLIYLSSVMNLPGKENDKKRILSSKIIDLVEADVIPSSHINFKHETEFIDANITFTKIGEKELLKHIPTVRIKLV